MNIFSDSTLKKINKYLNSGYNMRIDVGLSYNAPFLIKWVKTNRKNIVIGFEPHPSSFQNIEIKIRDFPKEDKDRIFIFNCAISNTGTPVSQKFFSTGSPNTAKDPGSSSLLKPIGRFDNSVVETFNVSVMSLDYFLNKLNYKIIEFIKIDTQGNDLAVLKSLKSHIPKVYMIQAERDCTDYYDRASTGSDLDDFMLDNNFKKVANTKNGMDSLYVNSLIRVLDFVPFRIDLILRKFPGILLNFVVKSPIIFFETLLASIIYSLRTNISIIYFKLKHLGKIVLRR
jgi:FkbM family methyltransferase